VSGVQVPPPLPKNLIKTYTYNKTAKQSLSNIELDSVRQ